MSAAVVFQYYLSYCYTRVCRLLLPLLLREGAQEVVTHAVVEGGVKGQRTFMHKYWCTEAMHIWGGGGGCYK